MRVCTGTIEIREGDTPMLIEYRFKRLRRLMEESMTKPAPRYEACDAPPPQEPSVTVTE